MNHNVKFYFLCDLDSAVKVKVRSLEGIQPVDTLEQLSADASSSSISGSALELLLECQVFLDGRPLAMPLYTKFRSFKNAQSVEWRETLQFPIKYSDLSAGGHSNCAMVFRVWNLSPQAAPKGGEEERRGGLHTGAGLAGQRGTDAKKRIFDTKGGLFNGQLVGGGSVRLFSEKGVLETGHRRIMLSPGFKSDDILTALDSKERLVNRINKEKRRQLHVDEEGSGQMEWLDKLERYRLQALSKQEEEPNATASMKKLTRQLNLKSQPCLAVRSKAVDLLYLTVSLPEFKYPVVYHSKYAGEPLPSILPNNHKERIVVLHDPAINKENPIELKFRRLAKNFGQNDQWLQVKPNGREREALKQIIDEPYHAKDIRPQDRELLWKFRMRLTQMKKTITRFLRCVDFNDPEEREEGLRMLPLWEKEKSVTSEDALELLSCDFLNPHLRSFAVKQLEKESNEEIEKYLMLLVQALQYESKYPSPLSKFICTRCSQRLSMANAVNWYLTVEAQENPRVFDPVLKDFRTGYLSSTPQGRLWRDELDTQRSMVEGVRSLCQQVITKGGKQSRRVENLRAALNKGGKFAHLTKFKRPVRFPLDPEIMVTGILPDKSTVFASNAFPFLIAFQREDNKDPVRVIYKDGDDLRQDQLIMQLVKLMDSRLKQRGMDLNIISFQVQGWTARDGIVEFVPGCSTVAKVIEDYKDIGKFLGEHNNKPKAMKKALNNWVNSSAGYSVLTYILAIGDRHLDNILLDTNGHMLHIDFGYIFGRDPKPFPPKVKFTQDMMNGMGGKEFEDHFYEKSCLSYNLLRRDACLILNLLYLTGDWAGNKKENLTCVRSRLALEREDDDAAKDYKQLIYKVMHSNFEALKDGIHTIATNLKK